MFETLSGCLFSIRYSNTAEILKQYVAGAGNTQPGYEVEQDEYGGGFVRTWYPTDPDNPADEPKIIQCLVTSPTGTAKGTENWGQIYENMRSLLMTYKNVNDVHEGDQVTNIKGNIDGTQQIIYRERNGDPTVFEVVGTQPVTDAFGRVVEWVAVLERAEVQDG